MKNKDVIAVLQDIHAVLNDLNKNEALIITDHELISVYKEAIRCAVLSLDYMQTRNEVIESRTHPRK